MSNKVIITLLVALVANISHAAGMSRPGCKDGIAGGTFTGVISGLSAGPKGALIGASVGGIGGAISGGCFRKPERPHGNLECHKSVANSKESPKK